MAQVRSHWFIPASVAKQQGHVTVAFRIARDGSVSGLSLQTASSVQTFNDAAYEAVATSSPFMPLPPEYDQTSASFTVTFYYNESPSERK
jgi:TonB family protein